MILKKKVHKKANTNSQTTKPKPCSGSQDVNVTRNPYLAIENTNLLICEESSDFSGRNPTPRVAERRASSPVITVKDEKLTWLRQQQTQLQRINSCLNELSISHEKNFQESDFVVIAERSCNEVQRFMFTKLESVTNLAS